MSLSVTADARPQAAASWLGLQRVGLLSGLPALLAEFGVSGERLAERAGVSLRELEDREAMIPFVAMGHLLAAARELSGRDDIGLLLGQRTDTLAALGQVGNLMRHAPDLGTALRDLATNQRRYVNGAVVYLLKAGGEALLGYAIHRQAVEAIPQILDASMGAGLNLLRGLGGVTPIEVQIARAKPQDPAAYRRAFGCPVRFDAPQTALVLSGDQLGTPVPGADRGRRRRLEDEVSAWWAVAQPCIVSEVERMLLPRVPIGESSLTRTAALLGLHPRTLERRLGKAGTTYRNLLSQVQLEVAGQLLRGTRMTAASIGEALGYGDPSAFGTWFRRATGESPARWRERAGPLSCGTLLSENHKQPRNGVP